MNTDVRHDGRVYHVQTEDHGASAPELVTQVYIEGQILRTARTPYEVGDPRDENDIRERLRRQHRIVIQAILRGRIAVEETAPAGPAAERPAMVVTPLQDLRAGEPADLLILLRGDHSFRPITDAELKILFDEGAGDPACIHRGRTDGKGFHLAEVSLPESDAAEIGLVIDAASSAGASRARLPVLPARVVESRGAPSRERPGLIVSDLEPPAAGREASFMILVRAEPSCRPIAGAELRLLIVLGDEAPTEIYRATTDRRGFHLAETTIPSEIASESSLVIEATTALGVAETLIPVLVSAGAG